MAETLKYLDELVAQFPDNTQGLIKAQDVRELIVSTTTRVAILQDEDVINTPITDGVLTHLNPIMVSPDFAGAGWDIDLNNYFVIDNGSATAPAGYTTLGRVTVFLVATKQGGGTGAYSFTVTRNNVAVGTPTVIPALSSAGQNVSFQSFVFVDRSVPSDTYGLAVQGEGTANDINIIPLEIVVADSILGQDPTP